MIFVVCGPSGCGKSTLIGRLMDGLPGLSFSVSHTTRPPRDGERDGVEYRFVSEAAFKRMSDAGRFVEWAVVHGHYYGTSKAELRRAGGGRTDAVLDIDVQGAEQVRAGIGGGAVFVFIMPPVADELKRRLESRGQDSPADIARRLKNAAAEVRQYRKFDYVVINDDLEQAAGELRSIVVSARCRTAVREAEARRVVRSFGKKEGGHGR